MRASDGAFVGSIPEFYDRLLGPLLFAPYAEDLAARASAIGPRRILEIAAGTGIVTAALALAGSAQIEATDINEAMVAHAASVRPLSSVRWSKADAMALPFDDGSFDLAVCQFGVMFFPDRVRAFGEVRRILEPGGTYLFNVWDGLETNEIPRFVDRTVAALFPDDPPGFLRRTPYAYGHPESIECDLRDSGFRDIACEPVVKPSRASGTLDVARGFCEGSPIRLEILERDPDGLARAVEATDAALRAHFGDGAIEASMRAYVFTARC